MAELTDFCLAFSERAFWTGFTVGAVFGLLSFVPVTYVVYQRGWLTGLRDVLK